MVRIGSVPMMKYSEPSLTMVPAGCFSASRFVVDSASDTRRTVSSAPPTERARSRTRFASVGSGFCVATSVAAAPVPGTRAT